MLVQSMDLVAVKLHYLKVLSLYPPFRDGSAMAISMFTQAGNKNVFK